MARLDASENLVNQLANEGKITRVYLGPRSPRIVESSVDKYLKEIGA